MTHPNLFDLSGKIALVTGGSRGVGAEVAKLLDALFGTLADRHGRLDILVNNTAANPYFGPIVKRPDLLAQILKHVPMRRVAAPSEMAGAALNVDGGYPSV